ncbi:MAG: UDP-glucose 4-epimerase GalE [Sumerlaeia bacterium]
MKVLVTGGAGYIGSVTVEALIARGDDVIVVDNLSTGHRGAVHPKAEFLEVDILDTPALIRAMVFKVDAVIHFAASSQVGESVKDPQKYMENNVGGTLSLLKAMRAAGVNKLVFSSTAAVYGEPGSVPITEDQPTAPANPYGMTKLFMEQAMQTFSDAYKLRSVRLRYFNACGASPNRGEHHDPETHLIPLVLQVAQGKRDDVKIFGTDYPTPDGTCVRDYIHVDDLARAHIAALEYLQNGGPSVSINLGNGQGYSVRQVIDVCRQVTGKDVRAAEAPRRAGDPSQLVASAEKARDLLGWAPEKSSLEQIVRDAWRWHQAHPSGYPESESTAPPPAPAMPNTAITDETAQTPVTQPSAGKSNEDERKPISATSTIGLGETMILQRTADKVGLRYSRLDEYDLDSKEAEKARGLISAEMAASKKFFPLSLEEKPGAAPILHIAVVDALDVTITDALQFMLPEYTIQPVVVKGANLKEVTRKYYGAEQGGAGAG